MTTTIGLTYPTQHNKYHHYIGS